MFATEMKLDDSIVFSESEITAEAIRGAMERLVPPRDLIGHQDRWGFMTLTGKSGDTTRTFLVGRSDDDLFSCRVEHNAGDEWILASPGSGSDLVPIFLGQLDQTPRDWCTDFTTALAAAICFWESGELLSSASWVSP